MDSLVLTDPVCRAIWSHVDRAFYLSTNEDVRAAGLDPVVHYAHTGWREGRDPSPAFSTRGYIERYADVRDAQINPLKHYVEIGFIEGRDVGPSEPEASPASPPSSTSESSDAASEELSRLLAAQAEAAEKAYRRSVVEAEFNAVYYLGRYPDVNAAGVDPLDHFMEAGWLEGRDPNPFFSTENYLELNEDVRKAGINPLFHFIAAGRREGRLAKLNLGYRYEVLRHNRKLEDQVAEIRRDRPVVKPSAPARLARAFDDWPRSKGKRLFVSASHDDFTRNFGGVQLVLIREAAAIEAMGVDHLHLFPSHFLPIVETGRPEPLMGVLKNGELLGHFKPSAIADALAQASPVKRCDFAIHSLIGHSAEGLAVVLEAAGAKAGWFWVHDYASVCTGYNLLRNDVQFCGAPPPDSTACSLCRYGGLRRRQIAAHRVLFERFHLSVVSPSQAALDVWTGGSDLPVRETRVLNHASLTGKGTRRLRADRPLRIGFLGLPTVHKGWPVFRELALRYAEDPRYSFHHLGSSSQPGLPISFDKVEVRPGSLHAMTEAVARLDLDVALIWSIWPETYCLTAYEAMSGGASVLTVADSGNVAAMVRRSGCGAVLPDESALYEAFADGSIRKLVGQRPKPEPLTFSRMSADLIGKAGR